MLLINGGGGEGENPGSLRLFLSVSSLAKNALAEMKVSGKESLLLIRRVFSRFLDQQASDWRRP